MTKRRDGFRRWAIWLAGPSMIAMLTGSAQSENSNECRILVNKNTEIVDKLKKSAQGGGYIFLIRHSNKVSNGGGGLTPGGREEARDSFSHMSDVLPDPKKADATPEGRKSIAIYEKSYHAPRIGETREAMMRGLSSTTIDITNLNEWLTKRHKERRNSAEENTFVFVNSDVINQLRCLGSVCQFACLEAAILKPSIGGGIEMCYRFFPAEWGNPIGEGRPDWVLDPTGHDASGECAGQR